MDVLMNHLIKKPNPSQLHIHMWPLLYVDQLLNLKYMVVMIINLLHPISTVRCGWS